MEPQGEDGKPSQILPFLYLGARHHAKDRETLLELKVHHILNVTPTRKDDPVAGVPNFFEKDQAFLYRRYPLYDNKAEDILRSLEGCVAFIDQGKYYGSVLVHCNKGVSRSTSIVIAYLMKMKKMSFEEALAHVHKCRPIAQPNETFMAQLREYERRLQRQQNKSSGVKGPARPAAAIGPALPPHLLARQQQQNGTNETPSEPPKKAIGPSLPAQRSIGPSLPPSAVGPQLPPRGNESTSTSITSEETRAQRTQGEEKKEDEKTNSKTNSTPETGSKRKLSNEGDDQGVRKRKLPLPS